MSPSPLLAEGIVIRPEREPSPNSRFVKISSALSLRLSCSILEITLAPTRDQNSWWITADKGEL